MLFYGAAAASLRWQSPAAADKPPYKALCKAWFCPGEFSDQRIYDLQRGAWEGRSDQSTSELERALVSDSSSAYRWADVAEMMVNTKRVATARYCFERALTAGPNNPAILCRAASFYFRTGESRATLRCLYTVLKDPDLDAYYLPAFITYSRMDLPISTILQDGIGSAPLSARAFLRFLMEQGRIADAHATWSWIAEHSLGSDQVAAEYLDFLLRKKEPERAAATWQQVNATLTPEYRRSNWIFNGNFEIPVRPSPLDWHIEPTDNVGIERVCDVSRQGRCAIQLAFGGKENTDFHGVSEQAVLAPGKWHLQGFVKTDRVTSDQGLSLRIYDPVDSRNLDIQTDPIAGTRDWTKIARGFEVRPATTLVRVEIARRASLKIDCKIAGKAWIDSVELRPGS